MACKCKGGWPSLGRRRCAFDAAAAAAPHARARQRMVCVCVCARRGGERYNHVHFISKCAWAHAPLWWCVCASHAEAKCARLLLCCCVRASGVCVS